ncbi:Rad2 nuclease [Entomortierella beljakovae]|nr:Rad2 nuclease [Entomortierella beljakovae]
MGIQGLLPLLKSIEKPVHLRDYAGQTLAIDGYVWLHRSTFACAQELCLGQPTQKYVSYFMRQIDMFKFFGVKPYVVFDGGYLPSKAVTEKERSSRREESRRQAAELLQGGKSKQALEQFRKCVDVTPSMAFAVIQALKAARVEYVVAPYEADSQLTYLEKIGLVDGIVTEDSDLIVFGCKKVIFKLDQYGSGIEILPKNLHLVKDVSFHQWTMTEIRHMCILAGCDYLPSIHGVGIKTAQRLLRRFKNYERVIRHMRMENTSAKISADYEESFLKADLTFLYARVYDPISKSMVHLNTVPEYLEQLIQTSDYDFIGPILEESIAQGIATGYLDPISKAPLGYPAELSTSHQPSSSKYLGKENRPYVDKIARESTKSICTYFTKTVKDDSKNSSTPNLEQTTKKRTLGTSGQVTTPTTTTIPTPAQSETSFGILPSHDGALSAAENKGPIVEARSRYFGFEVPSSSPERKPNSSVKIRSSAIREDSGVGLDEAYLLDIPFPTDFHESCGQSQQNTQETSSSSQSSESTTTAFESSLDISLLSETKNPESKVIQGWREKFTNPSGSISTRPTGLNRAVQTYNSGHTNKTSSTLRSNNIKSFTAKSTRHLSSQGFPSNGKGVVRTAPGLPPYFLDTARRPISACPKVAMSCGKI